MDGDARWILAYPGEAAEAWLDRVAERFDPFMLGAFRRREANTRMAWAKALVVAQAWTRRAEVGVWERALALLDDGTQDRQVLEKNLRAAAATVRAFPHVCAAALGLTPREVWEAVGGSGEPNAPAAFDPQAAASQLGFRVFMANRGRPARIVAELAARKGQEVAFVEEGACQGLRVTPVALRKMAAEEGSACQGSRAIPGDFQEEDCTPETACQGLRVIPPAVAVLRECEVRAAEALSALVRASRAARADDPEAADGALIRLVSLLAGEAGGLADWEVARLLERARDCVEAAEDRAAEILEEAEAEARRLREQAREEVEECRRLAAAAATEALRTATWRELRERIMYIVHNRYRLHLAPPQHDGLDTYREQVRILQLARDALPMLFDAIMARASGRAGMSLRQVVMSDFGAAEWGCLNRDVLLRLAENVAAAIRDLGLEARYEGLAEELDALDYPATATGFVSVSELLDATATQGREEIRAAVAAARSGRGRPVVPVTM